MHFLYGGVGGRETALTRGAILSNVEIEYATQVNLPPLPMQAITNQSSELNTQPMCVYEKQPARGATGSKNGQAYFLNAQPIR